MTKHPLTPNYRLNTWSTIIAPPLFFFLLLFRNSGLYPSVLKDEYAYSMYSRLLPLHQSLIPNYVYLELYRSTGWCGCGFLFCARSLNSLFFVLATVFVYLTAKRVCSASLAALIAILTLISPLNTYTAYYMPEAPYCFAFWLMTWYILSLNSSARLDAWAYVGVLLGICTLIKPHAVFILPSIVAYIFFTGRDGERGWQRSVLERAGVVGVSTYLTKFLISYVSAGRQGLSLVGPLYSSIASSAGSLPLLQLALMSIESAKGNVLAILLMFGVPSAIAINGGLFSARLAGPASVNRKIVLYTLSVSVVLVSVVCLFTASVHQTPRIHMRYYSFIFPLLLIIAAAQVSSNLHSTGMRLRAVVGSVIGCAIVYSLYTHLVPFTPNIADCPELRGFIAHSVIFHCLGGLSLLALILWIIRPKHGARLFIYIFMPLSVVCTELFVNIDLNTYRVPDVFDKAGIFARLYLSNEELSKLVVVGSDSDPGRLFKSLFYVDNAGASVHTLPQGSDYDLAELDAGKNWILIIGEHSLRGTPFFKLQLNGFELIRAAWNESVDFRESAWPGVIVRTQGLSSPEPWGTWSSGDFVSLEFSKPLPERFSVRLVADAFGPNVGKEFVAHVGNSAVRFTWEAKQGAVPEEKVLKFTNPGKSSTLRIDIPSPASPKELGLNPDERTLGIALVELQIVPE